MTLDWPVTLTALALLLVIGATGAWQRFRAPGTMILLAYTLLGSATTRALIASEAHDPRLLQGIAAGWPLLWLMLFIWVIAAARGGTPARSVGWALVYAWIAIAALAEAGALLDGKSAWLAAPGWVRWLLMALIVQLVFLVGLAMEQTHNPRSPPADWPTVSALAYVLWFALVFRTLLSVQFGDAPTTAESWLALALPAIWYAATVLALRAAHAAHCRRSFLLIAAAWLLPGTLLAVVLPTLASY